MIFQNMTKATKQYTSGAIYSAHKLKRGIQKRL